MAGSALRNVDPITEALAKLIDGPPVALAHKHLDSDTAGELKSYRIRNRHPSLRKLTNLGPSHPGPRRVLEIGSGDCTHLKHWADRWRGVEWWPTGRNKEEVR